MNELSAVVAEVIRRQSTRRLTLDAAGGAFWLVIAIFPATIATISVFGLIMSPDEIAARLTRLLGTSATSTFLVEQMQSVAQSTPTSLTVGLIVSVAVALWTVGTSAYNLSRGIRAAYGYAPQRYLAARVTSFIAAFVAVVALGTFAIAVSAGAALIEHLPTLLQGLAWIVGLPLALLLVSALVAALHLFAIGKRQGLRTVAPGSLLAGLVLIVMLAGVQYYLAWFPPNTAIYGALAGFVVFMLFVWIAVYVVLLAATLNAVLRDRATP